MHVSHSAFKTHCSCDLQRVSMLKRTTPECRLQTQCVCLHQITVRFLKKWLHYFWCSLARSSVEWAEMALYRDCIWSTQECTACSFVICGANWPSKQLGHEKFSIEARLQTTTRTSRMLPNSLEILPLHLYLGCNVARSKPPPLYLWQQVGVLLPTPAVTFQRWQSCAMVHSFTGICEWENDYNRSRWLVAPNELQGH